MKAIDYLKVDWPISAENKTNEDRKGDKLIERLDGGKAFVSPTPDLIPQKTKLKNDRLYGRYYYAMKRYSGRMYYSKFIIKFAIYA